MARKKGRTTNSNDSATLSDGISVGDTTSIKILDAGTAQDKIYIAVTVTGADAWIKLQSAATDNDKKGIFVRECQTYEFPADQLYIGEISAIAQSGTATIYTTEF